MVGLYWEEWQVGKTFESAARTITETDIVNFAGISGDYNPLHINEEYCKNTQFGTRIAHGPLIYGVAGGLQYASGINDGTLLALLQIDKWRLLAPVKHGDTIRMKSTVIEKKESSKPDRGTITFKRNIVNQHDTTVQEMIATILYRRRPR